MVSCEAGAETETPVCPLGTSGQTPVPAGAGVASMTALASPDSSTVVKRQFGSCGESHPPSSASQNSPRPAAEIATDARVDSRSSQASAVGADASVSLNGAASAVLSGEAKRGCTVRAWVWVSRNATSRNLLSGRVVRATRPRPNSAPSAAGSSTLHKRVSSSDQVRIFPPTTGLISTGSRFVVPVDSLTAGSPPHVVPPDRFRATR